MRMIPILLILFLLLSVPIDVADGSDTGYVRLSAVMPTGDSEGVAITNYGCDPIDLRDYHLSDGEGTVTFTDSIALDGGSTIFILKSEPESWMGIDDYLKHGDRGVTSKGFLLNDSGDDIYLYEGDTLVDSFVYGNVISDIGWNGDSFQKIPKKCYAKRTSLIDTDSSKDWEIHVPGRSDLTMPEGYASKITPFVFPDSKGTPVKDTIYGAKVSVDISVYILTDADVISSLLHVLSDGVKVRILLEGSPAGGIPLTERTAMATLVSWGADVRFIVSDDGYKRYDYLHSKYALIDGERTIVTSENWTDSSFNNNRGWGAIISSKGYTEYMGSIFESDFNGTMDIRTFKELYPKENKGTYSGYVPSGTSFASYDAIATPVLSPDFSHSAMKSFISSAKERLFVEQLEVEYDWLEGDDNPLSWMIDSPADSRLLIDVTFDSESDADTEDGYGIRDSLRGCDSIAVRTYSNDGMLHNKGIIADDRVWIGSINWSDTSIHDNREAGVIIESKDVSDLFAKYFIDDWGTESADDVVISVEVIGELTIGRTIMIDASGSYAPDGSLFEWDIDGDGTIDRNGERISLTLSERTYDITLRVTDGDEVHVWNTALEVNGNATDSFSIPLKYIPIIIICVVVLAASILYRRKCG